MSEYRKFIVAVIAIVLMILDHYFGPGSFVSQIVIAAAAALGVWTVPNDSGRLR